jgi:putative ABC transport system ATP-binding protein
VTALIEAHGVACRRGQILIEIESLAVAKGDQLAILGPSGAGKSTCLDLLALTLLPDAADLFAFTPPGEQSRDLASLWTKGARGALTGLRARWMGYILQTGGLLPFLSVRENILLSRRLLGLPCPGPAQALMERLGIAHLATRLPGQVSIGERQRVAIARALAHEPALVLADEPTASLDEASADKTMELLLDAVRLSGAALVMVSHDRELVGKFGFELLECRVEPGRTALSRVPAGVSA